MPKLRPNPRLDNYIYGRSDPVAVFLIRATIILWPVVLMAVALCLGGS